MFKKILLLFSLSTCLFACAQYNGKPATSTTGQIIKHTFYTLSYSPKDKQAEWVEYELTKDHVENGTEKRADNFRPDPLVGSATATLEDYKNSGYDRGHLAPAADMKFNSNAMSECFYLSNMSPMKPELNRGIWEKLEEQVREWAVLYDHLYIITGGILKSPEGTIGEGKVTVPKYFYKIVLCDKSSDIKEIAVIIPNEKGAKQLFEYAVPVDSIEKLTGIDFFPDLPDTIEKTLESKCDISKWDFSVKATNQKKSKPKTSKKSGRVYY